MHRYIVIVLVVLYSLLGRPADTWAQPTTLPEYVTLGLSSNLALKAQALQVEKSWVAVRQAKALFYPSVGFEANYTLAAGGRKIDFPIGDLLNPVYGTLNALTGTNNFPMLENQQIQFLPNNFQETKLTFAYPLYNTDLRYNRSIKELMVLGQEAQKAVYEQELTYQIQLAYLQLAQSRAAARIWENAKQIQLEMRRFNESLVKNNVATRDIVAETDYAISQTDQQIVDLQSKQNTARAYFNFLINRDLQSEVVLDSVWLAQNPVPYNLDSAIAMAWDRRREFELLNNGKNIAQTVVDMNAANRKMPDFYLGGETGFQGFGYHFGEQGYVLARVGMTYSVFDGGIQKNKVQEAKLEVAMLDNQMEQTRQKIAMQVTERFYALQSAQNALNVHQQGQKAAEEAFRIINNKYKAGQALHLEWTNAQNRVTTAQIQTLLARLTALQAWVQFQQAIGQ